MPISRGFSYTITVLVCLVLLGWYAIYLWNATVHKGPLSTGSLSAGPRPTTGSSGNSLQLALSFRIDPAALASPAARGKKGDLTAELVLTNRGPQTVYLLDGALPSVLLDVNLFYLGRDGKQTPRQLFVIGPAPAAPASSQAERFAEVELLAGRSLSLPVRLAPLYDLTEPGKYRLQGKYQPGVYLNAFSQNPEEYSVITETLNVAPFEFEALAAQAEPKAAPSFGPTPKVESKAAPASAAEKPAEAQP
jgi:hypothetical protein